MARRTGWTGLRSIAVPAAALQALLIATVPASAQGICEGISCGTSGAACTMTSTGLPLRLLVKPDANIFDDARQDAKIIAGNIPPFSTLYAFELKHCDAEGSSPFDSPVWYKVGYSDQTSIGYLSANMAVQWRTAQTVAYTNPGADERKRVLLFQDFSSLDTFVEMASAKEIDIEKTYREIEDLSAVPSGVRAIEQKTWVDIDRRLYLMPILQHASLQHHYPEGDFNALEVAVLTGKPKTETKPDCDLQNADSAACKQQETPEAKVKAIDIVWVIDMTLSMQPYIDAVAAAVRKASTALRAELGSESVIRFGLVGYRDDVEEAPWLEFVTRNFTPELLTREEFEALMAKGTIKAADKSTGDFPEEVFAGFREGVRSAWREDAARVMILIGDASGHEKDNRKNTESLSLDAAKTLADESQIYVASILLANPNSAADTAIAERQFGRLADNGGTTAFSKIPVTSTDNGSLGLEKALRDATNSILDFAATGNLAALGSGEGEAGSAGGAIKKAMRAAVVDFLGGEAEVPSNITAWVADRDIANLANKAFELRVAMTRKDLQELKQLIEALLADVREGNKSSSGFFRDLETGSTTAAMDLKISPSQAFAESDLVPRWISSLAYRSQVLSMSLEDFLQQPPDDRTAFEQRLEGLVDAYEHTLSNTDAWYALNDQDTENGQIHLLPLRLLP